MTSDFLRVDAADGVGTIVINNPPLNILTRDLLGRFRENLADLSEDEELRVLVVKAEGKHFSAGADVEEHLPGEFETLIPEFIETIRQLYGFPVPVIAAVRGKCLGAGFELVLSADIIVAESGAEFGQPEIFLGVAAPAACVLLPLLTSPTHAARILLSGNPLSANDAREMGIVGSVAPEGQLDTVVDDEVAVISRHSAAALRATKRMMRNGQANVEMALGTAQAIYTDQLMKSADSLEGLNAFLEKRKPIWSHR
ncbi:MAG: enoyl-CoA hydratase-related protein [Gemmatimonadota bacterium]|nr:enoyl-CoA hydratase-related protein [Gemmatimonadota bacterium]MDH5804812.1 enoyl-CoA hydratase-related protein [Gemmatimonadota bacterium]